MQLHSLLLLGVAGTTLAQIPAQYYQMIPPCARGPTVEIMKSGPCDPYDRACCCQDNSLYVKLTTGYSNWCNTYDDIRLFISFASAYCPDRPPPPLPAPTTTTIITPVTTTVYRNNTSMATIVRPVTYVTPICCGIKPPQYIPIPIPPPGPTNITWIAPPPPPPPILGPVSPPSSPPAVPAPPPVAPAPAPTPTPPAPVAPAPVAPAPVAPAPVAPAPVAPAPVAPAPVAPAPVAPAPVAPAPAPASPAPVSPAAASPAPPPTRTVVSGATNAPPPAFTASSAPPSLGGLGHIVATACAMVVMAFVFAEL